MTAVGRKTETNIEYRPNDDVTAIWTDAEHSSCWMSVSLNLGDNLSRDDVFTLADSLAALLAQHGMTSVHRD